MNHNQNNSFQNLIRPLVLIFHYFDRHDKDFRVFAPLIKSQKYLINDLITGYHQK